MASELAFIADGIAEIRGALRPEECTEIIAAFEAEPNTRPGVVFRPSGEEVVDLSLKKSEDFLIQPNSSARWLAVDQVLASALSAGLRRYIARYGWLKAFKTTFCGFQIQRTAEGQSFDWHADEDRRRRLAIIFYLNEGFDGGETEFATQGLSYRPREGSLLLFPPYWTHVHRGAPVTRGVKYIATSFLMWAT